MLLFTLLMRRLPLDKTQTRELRFSLGLMLIGIFFWVIRIRYFTFFWLQEFHFLNLIGLEIVGTVLIISGLVIIHRVYPFPHTIFGIILAFIILIINILDFFLYKNAIYREIQQFTPFILTLELLIITKLLEIGLRYFGNEELSVKWHHFAYIIFFGFTLPLYGIALLTVCDLYTEEFHYSIKLLLLSIPLIIAVLCFFIYYLITLARSFNFLLKVQEDDLLP